MVVPENVLVSTISAPASKYFLWTSAMACGWVKESKSLLPFRELGKSLKRVPL